MPHTFVVHYSEVALKGRNRPEFVRILRRNINRALSDLDATVTLGDGRILARVDGDPLLAAQKLSKVFGVAWFAEASAVGPDYDKIRGVVLELARAASGSTFKIEPRRSDKQFPIGSHELAMKLGAEVAAETSMKVDLSRPDVALHVDVTRGRALVYTERRRGPGGLPVGTSGRVIHLFSGGIDSPVAAWLLMKRGCRPIYLHFYLAPTPQSVIDSKITRLVKELSAYGGRSTLILVPFAEYQLATFGVPAEMEPSLFRRFMRMTAEALAPRFRAFGISTGDSLSQAASQTLWNLATFDQGSSLPVLRPLLTYDKEEIVGMAREIGTFQLSLEEYKDCCSILSRHPRTRAKAESISGYARELGFAELVWKSVEGGTLMSFDPYSGLSKVAPLAETLGGGPTGQAVLAGSPRGCPSAPSPRQNYKQAVAGGPR